MKIYQGKNLMRFPELIHGFSSRGAGNLSLKRGSPRKVVPNREKFLAKLGVDLDRIVSMECTHETKIGYVSEADWGRGAYSNKNWVKGTDSLITDVPGVFLFATFADCLPIFLFYPTKKVVGLIHAGWRGLDKKIAFKTIRDLEMKSHLEPGGWQVFIGPSIHKCCFEVEGESAKLLAGRAEHAFVDLQKLAVDQLKKAGVEAGNIEVSPLCTACNQPDFYSHRVSGISRGAMGAVIGLED